MLPDAADKEEPIRTGPSLDNSNLQSEPVEDFPIVGIGASAGGLAAFE